MIIPLRPPEFLVIGDIWFFYWAKGPNNHGKFGTKLGPTMSF